MRPQPRRRRTPEWVVLLPLHWLLMALAGLVFSATAQQLRDAESAQIQWEVLEECRLRADAVVDGDSFHALHQDRSYVFRLYSVDAPEADDKLEDRIKEQAAYFGIAPKDIPVAARLASKCTRELLEGRAFTVVTRWQNAMGRGYQARFYGLVLVGNTNLAEELVARGLCRIHGVRPSWPDAERGAAWVGMLKRLEQAARQKQAGLWNTHVFPRLTPPSKHPSPTDPTAQATPLTALVDLNKSSASELEELPGIGPTLSKRIIDHRPYRSVDDLDRVPGIGKATVDRIRPWVRVGRPPR